MTPEGVVKPGMRLGVYEIAALIGTGGMGQVYRARDTRLLRDVAVKVLPAAFVDDPERKARFQREARVLAALNHPNIAAIHGLEESGGVVALIMELVEGPTLAERLQRGPIAVEEAVRMAGQIAAAFEYAHEKGIIHRDLKPANLKLTVEGKIKVLDFGLAKALDDETRSSDPGNSTTLTMAATLAGSIMGTADYMAPEQAKGGTVNRGADIWAFGAVLFEMLTAQKAFGRDGLTETIAAVMRDEPNWNALPRTVPGPIDRLVRRCLIKDQSRRLQAMGEARIVTEEWLANPREPEKVKSRPVGWAVAAVMSVALAGLLAWMLTRPAPEAPMRRFQLKPALGDKSAPRDPAISPDGTMVAYVDGGRLWIHDLDKLEPREMPRTDGAQFTMWSPDSAWVAFVAKGKLWKMPSRGSEPVALASLSGVSMRHSASAGGGGWGEDGRIVFATGSSALLAVPAQGGEVTTLLNPDPKAEIDFHSASALPAGKGVLFIVHAFDGSPLAVFAGGARTALRLPRSSYFFPVYSPTGHVLFVRRDESSGMWAAPFSLAKMEVMGEPFPVVRGGNQPSVSHDGTLAFRWGSPSGNLLSLVDRAGNVLEAGKDLPAGGTSASISQDGRRILYVTGAGGAGAEVWLYDTGRRTRTRVAPGSGASWIPGDRMAYSAQSDGAYSIHVKPADSSREARRLAEGRLSSVSNDGKYIFFTRGDTLWYQSLDIDPKPVSLGKTAIGRSSTALSPDGRYLLYLVDESGRNEVYVARFPAMDRKWRVSVNGGATPKWNRRGDRLYFVRGRTLCEVDFESGEAPKIGAPRDLFTGDALDFLLEEFGYDIMPDGNSFLISRRTEERGSGTGIVVVQNWFREFREREPK